YCRDIICLCALFLDLHERVDCTQQKAVVVGEIEDPNRQPKDAQRGKDNYQCSPTQLVAYRSFLEEESSDGRERSNGSKRLRSDANEQIVEMHSDCLIFLPQSENVEALDRRRNLRSGIRWIRHRSPLHQPKKQIELLSANKTSTVSGYEFGCGFYQPCCPPKRFFSLLGRCVMSRLSENNCCGALDDLIAYRRITS